MVSVGKAVLSYYRHGLVPGFCKREIAKLKLLALENEVRAFVFYFSRSDRETCSFPNNTGNAEKIKFKLRAQRIEGMLTTTTFECSWII